jgi:hypothetical protein
VALPVWGTFDYVAVVPDSAAGHAAEWTVTCRSVEPPGPGESAVVKRLKAGWAAARRRLPVFAGHRSPGDRLVGHAPTLRVTDAGLTPEAPSHPSSPFTRPRVLRSRITLTAAGRWGATARATHFHVARGLITALRPGDVLHLARTGCAGLGLSVLRGGRLVAAAGAVDAVPLGDVEVGVPAAVIAEVEAVLKRRDPDFTYADLFRELPVEVSVGGRRHLRYRGRFALGEYDVYVGHGFRPGVPGEDMCVALSLKGECPVVAANASAQLLDLDGLAGGEW